MKYRHTAGLRLQAFPGCARRPSSHVPPPMWWYTLSVWSSAANTERLVMYTRGLHWTGKQHLRRRLCISLWRLYGTEDCRLRCTVNLVWPPDDSRNEKTADGERLSCRLTHGCRRDANSLLSDYKVWIQSRARASTSSKGTCAGKSLRASVGVG